MMRSTARAAARLAAKPASPTASAARTTILRSLVATPSTASARSASSLATTGTAAPAPANLRSLKRDISRIIDEDTADLAAAPDQGLLDYVKEQGLRITQDKEGLIKLSRTVGDYNVTVQFVPEVDEDDGMGGEEEGAEAAPKAEGEEGAEEGEGEDEAKLPSHQWEVDLTNTVAPQHNTVRLACLTSKQGQFSIEAITFDPQPAPTAAQQQALDMSGADERKQLYFDELGEAVQDKLFELLESLGVDDKLGQFVQHYAQVVRTQQYLDKLKQLKSFLQQ